MTTESEQKRPVRMKTRKQAAQYLGITYATLANLHKKGEGPKYYKIGGLNRYRVEDLDKFIESSAVEG